jgi:hypothetical protein
VTINFDDAEKVRDQRKIDYGDQEAINGETGRMWASMIRLHNKPDTVVRDLRIPSWLVPLMMSVAKDARLCVNKKEDSYVDALNYVNVAHDLDKRMEPRHDDGTKREPVSRAAVIHPLAGGDDVLPVDRRPDGGQ